MPSLLTHNPTRNLSRFVEGEAALDYIDPPLSLTPTERMVDVSFEFFPPKTDAGNQRLLQTLKKLSIWQPRFVSVTCGADGATIVATPTTVRTIRELFGLTVAPHIAMSRASRPQLQNLLRLYAAMGVRHAVAIRGDAPRIPTFDEGEDYYQNTVDFVADLSQNFGFEPIVAAYPDVHPLAESPQQDLDHLKRKVDAGAKHAITQFFFEAGTYLRFRDKAVAHGVHLPLIPGVMPLHNMGQILKFASGCGAKIPAGFIEHFARFEPETPAYIEAATDYCFDLCENLRAEGVKGFHFYTLNRDEIAYAVCHRLISLQQEDPLQQTQRL